MGRAKSAAGPFSIGVRLAGAAFASSVLASPTWVRLTIPLSSDCSMRRIDWRARGNVPSATY